eukprot:TRINITY_DN10441_c0_g1_i1.p1 TRINITY_DN10441_c0_g1~~TRINITY_DN10441_c0_g1_i1.p1  ORF type:complete len:915 (-),score=172.48 TRINITY_DN10441_c0_g1_i1:42-2708(-)
MWLPVVCLMGAAHKGNALVRRDHDTGGDLATSASEWSFCAKQYEECRCSGVVRWGNKDTWTSIQPPKDGSILVVQCSVDNLQDVLPGDPDKHCQCKGIANPMSVEVSDVSLSTEKSNKEKLVGEAYWLALGRDGVEQLHVAESVQWAEAIMSARDVDKDLIDKTKQILQQQGIGGRQLLKLHLEEFMHDGVPRGPAMELVEGIRSLNGQDLEWFFCAKQWSECRCQGRVRWGNKDHWTIIEPPSDRSVLSVQCNADKLPDILPGDDGKHCQCQGTVNPETTSDDVAALSDNGATRVEAEKKTEQSATRVKAEEKTEQSATRVKAEEKTEQSATRVKAEEKTEQSATRVKTEEKTEQSATHVKAEVKIEPPGGHQAQSVVNLATGGTGLRANETAGSKWIYCSAQWMDCQCASKMRWGEDGKWSVFEAPQEGSIYTKRCNTQELGDPVPGDSAKHCQCLVKTGSGFQNRLNPMLLTADTAEKAAAPLISSCEIIEAGRETEAGAIQWHAVKPFCSESWENSAQLLAALRAGPNMMNVTSRKKLMEARVDPRFAETYNSLERKDGWVPRAFVNYYAGSPGSKHSNMTEQLVRSVHMFSKEPIFVYNFGSRTPEDWTPERFPRLVLVHAAPLDPYARRSFNFNKIRALLMSRVLVGVQLDSDQFVAPGVDYMFSMTQREITETAPMPVLPVHFYSFTPKDNPRDVWWKRFCPDPPVCKAHSMRWGHAHPTWTFWSLPFYGRWLRRHFRDETLPAKTDGSLKLGELRVSSIPEDEDVLNVATWEEKGKKQWCKYDNDYHEFKDLLQWKPDDGAQIALGDIAADAKFYPQGAAKSFFTAHNCKDPKATAAMLDEIERRWKQGTYPPSTITYKGRLWRSGQELHESHPDLPCIF